jgi:hypothetical protein
MGAKSAVLLALCAAGVTAGTALGVALARTGDSRSGAVVRIERRRLEAEHVRMCPVTNQSGVLTCFGGPAPMPGEEFVLVGLDGFRGRARAVRAEPNNTQDPCGLGAAHDVHIELERGATTTGNVVVGVQGVDVEPSANLLIDAPEIAGKGSEESVWLALDGDGDGKADIAASGVPCPEERNRAPIARAAGRTVEAFCLHYWRRNDGEWQRVNRHVYYRCL